jgi:hypothetical protein
MRTIRTPASPLARAALAVTLCLALDSTAGACGGDEPAARPSPTSSPAPPTDDPPAYDVATEDVEAYVGAVLPAVRRVQRLGLRLNAVKGEDFADFKARIALMREDLPTLRRLLGQLLEVPVPRGDLRKVHGLLTAGVAAQVRGYALWVRADRLEAHSVRARAEDKMAAATKALRDYDDAMDRLAGLVGNA